MTLRKKTIIIFCITFILLLLALISFLRFILLDSFYDLEKQNAQQNVERVLKTLLYEQHNLDGIVVDWAMWDDTYMFIDDKNERYIKSNLTKETFENLRLNMVLFVNSSGQIVYSKGYDFTNRQETPVPIKNINKKSILVNHSNVFGYVYGLILLPEGPMLVASRPILGSQKQGPINGTLVFGRYLNTEEIEKLSHVTDLSVSLHRLNDLGKQPDVQAARISLSEGKTIFIEPLDENTIAGYALLKDIYGKPGVIMKIKMPREIYAQGQASVRYYVIALIIAGLVFGAVILLILQRVVLARLENLSKSVEVIGASNDLSARLEVSSTDELAGLARDINGMLRTLEQSQAKLRESEEKYRLVFENAPLGIVHYDNKGIITACNQYFVDIMGSDKELLIGLDMLSLSDVEVVEAVKKALSGQYGHYENYYQAMTSNKVALLKADFAPIISPDKTVNGGVCIVEDFTERKQAEEALFQEKERLHVTLSSIGDAVIAVNLIGKISLINPVAETLTGWSQNEALGRSLEKVFNIFNEKTRQPVQNPVRQVLTEGKIVGLAKDTALISRDGTVRSIADSAAPIRDTAGNILGAILVFRDVTETSKKEEALRASEARFRLIAENARDIIYRAQIIPERNFQYVSPAVTEVTGYVPEDFYDDPGIIYKLVHNDDLPLLEKMLTGTHDLNKTITLRLISKLKKLIWIELRAVPEYDKDGRLKAMEGIARDVTGRKQMEEQLTYQSSHDSLTGLYNRAYFEQELQHLEVAEKQFSVGIIICDVDGLKLVNDTLGHDAGDKLLQAAARVIKDSFRQEDLIARIGGDEFAVLLPNCDDDAVKRGHKRIQVAVNNYNQENPQLLSISTGFAVGTNEHVSLNNIFKEADNNMYREKLHRKQSIRSALVQTMMKALEARDFITEGHGDRLQNLVVKMGKSINFSESQIKDLHLFAQFHDIGKVGISDKILFKPGPLTAEEASEMQRHCEIGHRVALSSPDLVPIADWILKHHEWWNGKGYPMGLKGEEIPLECQILAIADAYDAMTSNRPYRKPMSHEKAISELKKCAGTQFDPYLVGKFIELLNN